MINKTNFIIFIILFLVTSCGYTQRDSELIGQVKKVYNITPLICPNFISSDISLGVIRNGIGSMSKEDVILYVRNQQQEELLKQAQDNNQLVKIHYDVKRITFCVPKEQITEVEILK